MAYEPVNTPVTLRSIMRSRSVRFFVRSIYSLTALRCASVVSIGTSSLSGASTMNVTPNMVSARVVNIVNFTSLSFTLNCISVPSLRPIQLRCVSFSDSVQSIFSRPSSILCAYADTRRHHCFIFFCTTGNPPRSDTPSTTSSLASTVPNSGHQFTIVSFRNAMRQFIRSSCCSFFSNLFHSVALMFISCVHAAFIPAVPSLDSLSSSSSIGLQQLLSLS